MPLSKILMKIVEAGKLQSAQMPLITEAVLGGISAALERLDLAGLLRVAAHGAAAAHTLFHTGQQNSNNVLTRYSSLQLFQIG